MLQEGTIAGDKERERRENQQQLITEHGEEDTPKTDGLWRVRYHLNVPIGFDEIKVAEIIEATLLASLIKMTKGKDGKIKEHEIMSADDFKLTKIKGNWGNAKRVEKERALYGMEGKGRWVNLPDGKKKWESGAFWNGMFVPGRWEVMTSLERQAKKEGKALSLSSKSGKTEDLMYFFDGMEFDYHVPPEGESPDRGRWIKGCWVPGKWTTPEIHGSG